MESAKDMEETTPPSTSSSPSHTVQIYSNEDHKMRSPKPLQDTEREDPGVGMRNRAVSKYIAPGSRRSALEGKSNQTGSIENDHHYNYYNYLA